MFSYFSIKYKCVNISYIKFLFSPIDYSEKKKLYRLELANNLSVVGETGY